MNVSDQKSEGKKKGNEIKTIPVPFALSEIKENITINTNTPTKPTKEKIINQGIQFHLKGNIPEATKYYKYCIKQGFNDHRVFSNYGIILQGLGKLKDAELSYRKAIEIKPDFAEAYSNLGIILKNRGELEEAELSQRKAIELKPNHAEAHANLGSILKELGNLQEAEVSTRKAIELKPNHAEAHANLGIILKDLGNLEEAEGSTRKAIELKPNHAEAYSNLGSILKDLGNLKEAELSTRKAIKIDPNFAIAHLNLGSVLKDLGNLQEAEASTRKAIKLNPDFAVAHFNLGNILGNLGGLKEAELSYRKAIILNPKFSDAYLNLSLIELLQGNYECGLENYEFRIKTKEFAIAHTNSKLKIIDNKQLQKGEKLLVISEQAPGDIIFHMRYLLPFKQQGINLSFCAPKKLHSLIKDSGIHPNPLSPEECSLVKEGKWIPLLSLLKYFSINPQKPLINTPYISSTKTLKEKWRNILSKEKKPIIGINWQGSKQTEKSYQGRSLPLEKFSTLLEKNDISFISFQKGFGSEQMEKCSFKEHFVSSQDQIESIWDYSETSAIIESCDLIITNDCSLGPLAAGMGKKVWLLLRDIPFWYWGLEGETTFWYPSMRLFRQRARDDWDEVMERVSNQLHTEFGK